MTEDQEQLIIKCLCGNEDAVRLAHMLANASQVFDDLVDGDGSVTRQDLYNVLKDLLVNVHYNSFFSAYKAEMVVSLEQAVNSWIYANDIEESKDPSLMHVSLVTKSSFTPLLLHMAALIGGAEHARRMAPEVYAAVFDETLDEYMEEHGVEHTY